MTSLDTLLVHIVSLACFQGKFSRDFSLFVGTNTLLKWREFLSALKMIFFKYLRARMFERVILTPCIDMLGKVVCGLKAVILFLCFEVEIQFKKPIVFLKQLESLLAVKYLCKSFITLSSPKHNSLFGCDIVFQQCAIDSG